MNLGKLKDDFTKLSAIEIVKYIAFDKINGMWLTDVEHRKAKEVADNITEEEAIKLLNEFDKSRQYKYNFWTMFN